MNKKTKGAVAAGAAALLLAGGAGSFALWSDSDNLGGAAITAGKLGLTAGASPEWKDQNGADVDFDTYKAAPGDVLTYTNTVTVDIEGNNLSATLDITPGSITDGLASVLSVGTVTAKIGNDPVTTLTKANNGNAVSVSFPVTFNESAGNVTMEQTGTLSNLTLDLNQVDPTP